MSLTTALFALLVAAPLPRLTAPGYEVPARLEVLEGRVMAALPTGVLRLELGSPAQRFAGPMHVELAAATRARVGWSGLGSLLLEGRTILEWKPPPERGGLLRWTFVEVDQASMEVRRGRVHVELPGGWRGLLEPGAYSLRGLPGGPVEFRHDAGLPVTLWPPPGQVKARPPYTVLAGGAVRLLGEAQRPLTLPDSKARLQEPYVRLGFEEQARTSLAAFPAWEGFSWPWSRTEEASSPTSPTPEGHGPLGELLPPQPATVAGAGTLIDPATGQVLDVADAPPASGGPGTPTPSQEPNRAWTFEPVRSEGQLMLTPYGPRWVDMVLVLTSRGGALAPPPREP